MKKPDIIMLVPVYQCADVFDERSKFVKELDTKPSRIVFCENNSTDDTLKKVKAFKMKGVKTEVIRFYTADMRNREVFPFEKCYDVVAHARQLLLTRARQINPDYAVYVDSDIYLQDPTTLESLTIWQKDIIGGLYSRVFPGGVYIATLFYSDSRLKEKAGMWIKLKKFPMGVLLSEVHATSGGLLCLSRKAIQNKELNFYPVIEGYSEDFGFCKRAHDLGFTVWVDGTVNVGHKITAKWRAWDIIRKEDNERSKAFDDGSLIDKIKEEVSKRKKEEEERKEILAKYMSRRKKNEI